MAQSTVELGRLINNTNFELFDFPYTVDDAAFKLDVEQKIIDFYYDYEIGFETPDMFKRKFKARFMRAIGYYNQLYNTTLLSYNPLINSKMSEALEQLATSSNQQQSTANSTTEQLSTDNNNIVTNQDSLTTDNTTAASQGGGTNNNNTKSSDYPQQSISGGDFLSGEQNLVGTNTNNNTTNNTGTTANDSNSSTTTVGSGTNDLTNVTSGNATDNGSVNTEYVKTIEGITGTTYQDLITKERELILRIPQVIIEELKHCFILVH